MDRKRIAIDVLTYEEAADILKLEPETIKKAVKNGEIKADRNCHIPGYALSDWWKSIGGKDGLFLEDYLEKIPWLPVIYARAVEAFSERSSARGWLFKPHMLMGWKSPIEFAVDYPVDVLDLLSRLVYGEYSC